MTYLLGYMNKETKDLVITLTVAMEIAQSTPGKTER